MLGYHEYVSVPFFPMGRYKDNWPLNKDIEEIIKYLKSHFIKYHIKTPPLLFTFHRIIRSHHMHIHYPCFVLTGITWGNCMLSFLASKLYWKSVQCCHCICYPNPQIPIFLTSECGIFSFSFLKSLVYKGTQFLWFAQKK